MVQLLHAQIKNVINQAQVKTDFPEDELFVLKNALRSLSKGIEPDEAICKALKKLREIKPD